MEKKGNPLQKIKERVVNMLSRITISIPEESRALFGEKRLNTNINRMYGFSWYVIILQITLNVINMLRPSDNKSGDIMIYVFLSLGTLALGVIYMVLFTLVKKNRIKKPLIKRILVESFLYIYIGIQLVFCTLNILSTGGVNSYIIAILIIGMVPIVRPLQSLLSIGSSFVYVLLAMYFSRDVSGAWGSIQVTDAWANLIIITGITMCISVLIYRMYVSNFLQEVGLQQINASLEETVLHRTKELEEQTEAAQEASKTKSDFLAKMSHEIRTPLNAIIGMTQIAKRADNKEKILSSVNEIETASSHLLEILNDILDMSKIESGKFEMSEEEFSLNKALREVTAIIGLRCKEKNISLTVDIDAIKNDMVLGDKLRLKQILINLLGNAVKFTPDGKDVSFEVKVTDETDSRISINFRISDTGIGMSESQVSKLFVAFEQTDAKIAARYGGTGLGLAISQNLVMKMGGAIKVKSRQNYGSLFYFDLTFAKVNAPDEPVFAPADELIDLTGKRILLAEDIAINRIILQELLSPTNVFIEESEDGEDALQKFSDSPEHFYDLILMDIQMPKMDGYDTTRAIRLLDRADAKTVPIVAMTANAYKEDVDKAIASGMNGHLSKPIDIAAVLQMLSDKMNV